jgi:hypothetical protein
MEAGELRQAGGFFGVIDQNAVGGVDVTVDDVAEKVLGGREEGGGRREGGGGRREGEAGGIELARLEPSSWS